MPEPLFNKVTGLRPAALLKKALAQVLSCEFYEISQNTFSTKHLWTTASVFFLNNKNNISEPKFISNTYNIYTSTEKKDLFNPLQPGVPYPYPLLSENFYVFQCLKGV